MCVDCGCSVRGKEETHDHEHHHDHVGDNPHLSDPKTIEVVKSLLEKNDHEAAHNRAHFDNRNVLGINLMSSPGSGKTTLLEALKGVADFNYCVVEGDLETNKDADRLNAKGIQAVQIQTGSACHLDAMMVHKALHDIDLDAIDVCFVENVGNLVCPASYDVGTHLNVVLVSIPEGEDKIAKYPVMFRKADLVLFTKVDLLPYFEYDIQKEKATLRALNPSADVLEVSIKENDSLKAFAQWIDFKKKMR